MAVAVFPSTAGSEFAIDVREGLSNRTQKRLPSKYLYDDLGTALFDAICLLPEYGLTRAELRLLDQHADTMVAGLPEQLMVAELGSGTGRKTRILLEAIRRKKNGRQAQTLYHPIEISNSALERCARELASLPGVRCEGIQQEYLGGLREIATRRGQDEHLLVLFLGSSIGNFGEQEGREFLSEVRAMLQPGDALLLATDLVKPAEQLLAAYDDATGVTAAFNLNVLGRINRELRGAFDLSKFTHEAHYNQLTRSIEMHLRASADQVVYIRSLGMRFRIAAGETIWTETSHKYLLRELCELALAANFRPAGQWLDHPWGFAENLWRVSE